MQKKSTRSGYSIQQFYHERFGKIRVVILNGTVYFMGIDVAKSLGFKDTDKTIRNRVKSQDKIKFNPQDFKGDLKGGVAEDKGDLKGGVAENIRIPKGSVLINESGLWQLVLYSRLPKAKEMQHWITAEVLPSIRKNGYYINPRFTPANPLEHPALSKGYIPRFKKIEILREILQNTQNQELKEKIIEEIFYLLKD